MIFMLTPIVVLIQLYVFELGLRQSII